MWTLCGISTLFLASRFALRISTKGKLIVNDYFLVPALPILFIGASVLHSTLGPLYAIYEDTRPESREQHIQRTSVAPRLTASIEMFWVVVYCVKLCFLAQFKFHKSLYAYVSMHLTRHYWGSVGICLIALIFTLVQPVILCSNAGNIHQHR
jgi:hypothetical protein